MNLIVLKSMQLPFNIHANIATVLSLYRTVSHYPQLFSLRFSIPFTGDYQQQQEKALEVDCSWRNISQIKKEIEKYCFNLCPEKRTVTRHITKKTFETFLLIRGRLFSSCMRKSMKSFNFYLLNFLSDIFCPLWQQMLISFSITEKRNSSQGKQFTNKIISCVRGQNLKHFFTLLCFNYDEEIEKNSKEKYAKKLSLNGDIKSLFLIFFFKK